MKNGILLIFSGLPGVGKTMLAQRLAQYTKFTYLRIDTIEQALRDLCNICVKGEGYRLSYKIAQDNLINGNSVIADSCNTIMLSRKEWHDVALKTGARFIDIEIVCSDLTEHQNRIETRKMDIRNLQAPSWTDVLNREYHNWNDDKRVVIDTARITQEEALCDLVDKLKEKDFI